MVFSILSSSALLKKYALLAKFTVPQKPCIRKKVFGVSHFVVL